LHHDTSAQYSRQLFDAAAAACARNAGQQKNPAESGLMLVLEEDDGPISSFHQLMSHTMK